MKNYLLLVALGWLLSLNLVNAQALADKKIKFSYQDKALDLVFFDLEINERLSFIYEKEDIEGIRISKSIPRLPLTEALGILLEQTGLQYKLEPPNKVVIFIRGTQPTLITPAAATGPERFNIKASGVVKDRLTGETLPFANLFVRGTSIGTNSNLDGWFTLFGIPSDTALIEVSYLGYQAQLLRLTPELDIANLLVELQPAGETLQEVIVSRTRKDQLVQASTGISKLAVAPAQVSALPSLGEKDIFRSLQLLPGVSGSNESSSGLYVRGGTPDQNLVLFDGFTVYHVDHLFGFFSAFNSNAIKDVQLHKGGFEAKYGGRLASVVDITGKDGNTEELSIGGGLSLLSANAYVEGPFAKGRGSFLVTGRRSFQSNFYNNLLEFSDGDEDTGTNEDNGDEEQQGPGRRGFGRAEPNSWFYDLNAKVTYRTEKDIFSASLYNGRDELDNSRDNNQNTFGGGGPFGGGGGRDFNFSLDIFDESHWGNSGSSFKWSRRWNDQLYSNALLSQSNYFSFRDRGVNSVIERDTTTTTINNSTTEDNDLRDFSFRWDWEWQPSLVHKIGFGVFGTAFDIKYDYIQNDTTTVLARDDQGQLGGAYAQVNSTIADKFIIVPGVRLSYFQPTNKAYVEPRLQLQYLLSDRIKLKAATGRYYQFANRVIREDIAQGSRDFWVLADGERVSVGHSDHFIAGVSYETSDYLIDVEGYAKTLDNITEYSTRFVLNGFGRETSLDFEENFFNGTGLAQGVELLLQKKAGKLSGWLSYTLGRVEHQFDVFGEDAFPASHDVTNELKLVAMYRVGRWSLGGTFIYATGQPYTAPLGAYTVELLDGNTTDHFAISDKNAVRLPDYHRLDLSVNYDYDYFLGGKGAFGFSLFNVYNRQNIWYKEYEVVEGYIVETDVNLLGITPSFYFNWTLQ